LKFLNPNYYLSNEKPNINVVEQWSKFFILLFKLIKAKSEKNGTKKFVKTLKHV
jgi:hypothetical protein